MVCQIRAGRGSRVGWRELFEIPSKGGNEKRGEETKILKRGWGYGFIKVGGWNSLTNYDNLGKLAK